MLKKPGLRYYPEGPPWTRKTARSPSRYWFDMFSINDLHLIPAVHLHNTLSLLCILLREIEAIYSRIRQLILEESCSHFEAMVWFRGLSYDSYNVFQFLITVLTVHSHQGIFLRERWQVLQLGVEFSPLVKKFIAYTKKLELGRPVKRLPVIRPTIDRIVFRILLVLRLVERNYWPLSPYPPLY